MDGTVRPSDDAHHHVVSSRAKNRPVYFGSDTSNYEQGRARRPRENDAFASSQGSHQPGHFSTIDPFNTGARPVRSGSERRVHGMKTDDMVPRRLSLETARSYASTRRSSSTTSFANHSAYGMYSAPDKPLPPLPPSATGSSTSIGRPSSMGSSRPSSRYSDVSTTIVAGRHRSPSVFSTPANHFTAVFSHQQVDHSSRHYTLELSLKNFVMSDDKRINNSIHHMDMSPTSSFLASKHGNNIIKVWLLATGGVQGQIRFSSYTEAQSRSRDYLIRSHAILSEASQLIAIATKFGRTLEIWDWERKKCLQVIDGADRWAAGKMEAYDHAWGRLAVYRGDCGMIDLYAARKEKKPFAKARSIDLIKANLPFLPQYPELALSATSPLLVIAAGPRPPRQGSPPPERETLLVAWDINDDGTPSNRPHRMVQPWQHEELDSAIPSDLVTYGSLVVSIWIPASYRTVPAPTSRGGSGYNLTHVQVTSRYVLVWDLAASSTRTFGIPNCTACISPDCRYVAYCHASGAAIGARGTLAVLDVISGREVWCWPDKNAIASESGPKPGLSQFDDLGKVTELCFSADSKSLIVGDGDGQACIYAIQPKAVA